MSQTNQPSTARLVTDRNLSGTGYTNVNLESAAFNDVNLRRASFDDINLADATFMNVNMTNVSIREARLDGMTINGILVADLLRVHRAQQVRGAHAEDASAPAVRSNTVFHVTNLAKSLEFYTQRLGFAVDFTFGTPDSYAGLVRDNVHLHISSSYPYKDNTGHGNLYIQCVDVDQLYAQLDSAGVEFYSRIDDREYGLRDFAIKDPDGNQIGFGAPMAR